MTGGSLRPSLPYLRRGVVRVGPPLPHHLRVCGEASRRGACAPTHSAAHKVDVSDIVSLTGTSSRPGRELPPGWRSCWEVLTNISCLSISCANICPMRVVVLNSRSAHTWIANRPGAKRTTTAFRVYIHGAHTSVRGLPLAMSSDVHACMLHRPSPKFIPVSSGTVPPPVCKLTMSVQDWVGAEHLVHKACRHHASRVSAACPRPPRISNWANIRMSLCVLQSPFPARCKGNLLRRT